MTRAISLVIAIAFASNAAADPVKRKSAPDKFAKAAGEAFLEALAADQKGDLPIALGLYQKAFAISPHPSTAFNIGDVQRRLKRYDEAIKFLEMYLLLASDPADRKEVEATIDKLTKTPGTIKLLTSQQSDPRAIDFKPAYVFVDGELVKKPGIEAHFDQNSSRPMLEIEVAPGRHVIDVITPLSYGDVECTVRSGETKDCYVTAPPRTDGSVVASASDRDFKLLDKAKGKTLTKSRFPLAAGRHRMMVRDRGFECAPVAIDVPKSGDVAFVYFSNAEFEFERCRDVVVKQHKLHFDP